MPASEKTILITVIKGKSEEGPWLDTWQEKMNHIVSGFPGFISLEMQAALPGSKEWTIVQHFHSENEMKAWQFSDVRKELLNEIKPYLIDEIRDQQSSTSAQMLGLTEVFVTTVKKGNYDAFRSWSSKIQKIESRFPGYQGVYIHAPPRDSDESWITIVRFDSQENLERWLNSAERAEILKELEPLVEHLQSHQMASPFAGWFSEIAKAKGETPGVWKQTMLVLLVLFPIVMLEIKFLSPFISNLNTSLATFIGNAISVTLVSWPMIPIALKFLGWWAAPGKINRMRKNILGTLTVLGLYLIEIIALWRLF